MQYMELCAANSHHAYKPSYTEEEADQGDHIIMFFLLDVYVPYPMQNQVLNTYS
ncbi:hypothetical protein IMM1_35920 [Pseudocoprococcus immobilis]